MTAFPDMIRNVAVVGHLHHGKTALMDMLVFETHKLVWDADHQVSTLFMSPTQLMICSRRDTPTPTSWPGNVKYQSNLLQCLSFYPQLPGSLI
jgi:translation initiation factor 2 gamma subunit (eIF-2gamma)